MTTGFIMYALIYVISGISVPESQTFLLAKRPSTAMSEEKRYHYDYAEPFSVITVKILDNPSNRCKSLTCSVAEGGWKDWHCSVLIIRVQHTAARVFTIGVNPAEIVI